MATDDFVEAGLERMRIQLSDQARCPADIVGRAIRLQLFQEPKPFLGKRQRRWFAVCAGEIGGGAIFVADDRWRSRAENLRFTFGDLSAQIGWQLPFGALTCRRSPSALSLTPRSWRYVINSPVSINRTPRAGLYPIPRAVCPVVRSESTFLAKPTTVGFSKNVDRSRLTPKASPMRTAARAASREWPPIRKKFSSMPTSQRPSNFDKNLAKLVFNLVARR